MQSTTIIDVTPAALAAALDTLVQMTLEPDREVAAVLSTCRESLRAISWNRWTDLNNRRARAPILRRRHQGHQGGRNHA